MDKYRSNHGVNFIACSNRFEYELDLIVKVYFLNNVTQRENLWKRMEDIEARGRDASRLFGSRGCALLQEEKERKKMM